MKLGFTLSLLALWFPAHRATAAEVDSLKVPSAAMHREIPVRAVVPAARASDPTRRFPTLYLLHGAGDTESTWIDRTPVRDLADTHGMIIITPSAGTSWYFDSPVDPSSQFETFVARELVAFIDARYPTIPRAEARALAGNSMGGHGALFLAVRHRDTFKIAAPMSGGMDIRASDPQVGKFSKNWDIESRLGPLDEHPARWKESTVIGVVDSLKDGYLAISIDCGDRDFFLATNRELHAKLTGMGIAHQYQEHPGGHSWDYWKRSLPRQTAFIARQFARIP